MKTKTLHLFSLLIAIVIFSGCNKSRQPAQNISSAKGTAVLITGAAARIPQEAALLEKLFKDGNLKNVVFIGGASSGALNAVMLNGILSGKITWEQYIRWLNEISNDSVFINLEKRLPVDTSPLRNYLTRIVNDSLGYYKLKDLPITTAISITELNLLDIPKKNYRLSNKKINTESDPNLDIIDVLMASTAFPVVFPEQKIKNASTLPDKTFVDGGMGEDHVPFSGLIDFIRTRNESVEKVYIISRKSDLVPDINHELEAVGIGDIKVFNRLGISLDEILQKGFIKGLKEYAEKLPDLVNRTFVYIPEFEQKFLLLNFNTLQEQYLLTKKWAAKNKPVLLSLYLTNFE